MSKLSLDGVTSSFNFQAAYNDVLQRIEEEFSDKVLYRNNPEGEPNSMNNDLDMSEHDILNVGVISAAGFNVNGKDITSTIVELTEQIEQAVLDAETAATEAESSANAADGFADEAESWANISISNAIKSVKDYGAVGDGVTDDTAAIQECFDVDTKAYFPIGVYLISDSLVVKRGGFHIYGDGPKSEIKLADNIQRKNIIDSVGYDELVVENIKVNHNGDRGGLFSRHAPAASLTNNSGLSINGNFSPGVTTINFTATTLAGSFNTGDTFRVTGDDTIYTATNNVAVTGGINLTGVQFTPALVLSATNGTTVGIYQFPRYKAKTTYPIGTTTLTLDCARIVANPSPFDATAIRPGEQFQFHRRVAGSLLEYEVDPTHDTVYTVTSTNTYITLAGIGNEFQNITITPPLTKAVDKFSYITSIQDANNRFSNGIYLGETSNSRVQNVSIYGTPMHSILLGTGPILAVGNSEGGNFCSVLDNKVEYFGGNAIAVAKTRKCVISGNKISNNYTLVGQGVQLDNDCDETVVTGNIISLVNYGVMVYGNGSVNIIGNVISQPVIGILTDATAGDISITGNSILGTAATIRGIMCRQPQTISGIPSSNITITGNTIKNIIGTNGFGIYLAQVTTTPTTTIVDDNSNVAVSANVITTTTADGIRMFDNTGISVMGNTILFAGGYGIYGLNLSQASITANIVRNSGSAGMYFIDSTRLVFSGNISEKIAGTTTTMTAGLEFGTGVTNFSIDASNRFLGGTRWYTNVPTPIKGRLYTEATLDFPSIAANSNTSLTVTLTGVAVGDSVVVAPPGSGVSVIYFNAYVSAANTITVRAYNPTASPIDLASGIFGFDVTQFERF